MFRLLKMQRSFIVLLITIPFMTILSIVIYTEYIQTKEDVFKIIKEHLIDEKLHLLENYSESVSSNFDINIKKSFAADEELTLEYEDKLRLIEGDEIKYLYLLHKDVNGDFRFLIDATLDVNEKAEFNQKFNPQTEIWNKAYETGEVQIVHQKELDQLWVSIAYPILLERQVIAVIGADFTYDVYTQIIKTLNPLESLYSYVGVFILLMLILAYILMYLYYKTRKKSFIDPLTQTYNRQYLSEFLERSSLKNHHIMMIDLDHFKQVNDHYGHDVGDEVLITISQKIKNIIRKEDTLIRFGGEEFILFVYKQEIRASIDIANRIRNTIKNTVIHTDMNQISITLSIGVNPYPFHAKNIEEAIKIADEQLYIAKSSGRNRVEVFNDKEKESSSSSKRISDIHLAIDEQRITCAYQAIHSSKDRKIIKYEMLMRLIEKDGKIVAPNEFLSSIRNTHVYVSLTAIVLDLAIKTLKEKDCEVSINLDIQDLLNDDLMQLIKDKLENEQNLAKRLTVEILEHEEITNFTMIKKRIDFLKSMGVLIALDDFGSGYANFNYLINLDIDILKIDGSIIKNIEIDKPSYQIVKAIIAFAKGMGMTTVAEQVETKEECDILCALGVDCVQGYYLGRPEFDLK